MHPGAHYLCAIVQVHPRHCFLQDAVPYWNQWSFECTVSSDASDDNFTHSAQRNSCFRSVTYFGSNMSSEPF
jgi:hypothetical protein